MDAKILKIFRGEVRRQCGHALMAHCDLKRALDDGETDRIWYSIQALLAATANISKLLWPTGPRRPEARLPERGNDLRTNLDVPEISPLESREFRNHFEHFDERIEDWATDTERRNFIDSNINVQIPGIDPTDYLRNFDSESFTLSFWGKEHPLEPVMEAIRQLHDAASPP